MVSAVQKKPRWEGHTIARRGHRVQTQALEHGELSRLPHDGSKEGESSRVRMKALE